MIHPGLTDRTPFGSVSASGGVRAKWARPVPRGTIWEEERDEGFACGDQPLAADERHVLEPRRLADADRRPGAERRPVEVVAGVHPQHRRHRDVRHGRRLLEGHAARLQGQGLRLVDRPERRLSRYRPQGARGVLGRLEGDLSEHRDRLSEHRLQPAARQAAHGAPRQRRADGGAPADPGRRRVRRQGLLRRAEARGCRLHDGGFLAGRDEVGDV